MASPGRTAGPSARAAVRYARTSWPRLPFDRGTALRVTGRAALLWLLVRLVYTGFSAALAEGAGAGPLPARLLLVGVVVALCAVDARAAREPIFHANLGIGGRTGHGLAALTAALLELAGGAVLAAHLA